MIFKKSKRAKDEREKIDITKANAQPYNSEKDQPSNFEKDQPNIFENSEGIKTIPDCQMPNHIAYIMDGNGRWAQKRGLPRSEGHKNAEKAIVSAVKCAGEYGIKTVTLFAFSTENWGRSEEEKNTIFSLLESFLKKFSKTCVERQIKVKIIGDIEPFKQNGIYDSIINIQDKTCDFTKYNLNIALNYGGRQEILQACNKAIANGKQITQKEFEDLLYTAGGDDPDLIVRTSGEQRISNFMLYQSAYSELYFAECLWPDFNEEEFIKAVKAYSNRKRRFGKI